MKRTKELEMALNELKNNLWLIGFGVERGSCIIEYIEKLEKKVEEQEAIIEDFENKKDFHNARLIATWHETNQAHIYRKYYMLFNGCIYNLEVYANSDNFSNLGAVPTYLNADVQLWIKGKQGLADCTPIDYYTFKRCYSGI